MRFVAGPSSLMEPASLKHASSGSVEPDWIATGVLEAGLCLGSLTRWTVRIAPRLWDLV
jgi:hypothetical protein